MVSIVVPNYNHSKFLEERIESILNQTYRDFELIILDDCSTDNSRTIIEKYRNNEKASVIAYNDVNSGSPFQQWKKGMRLAKGDYIWIAESDDSSSPLFLEKLLPLLTDNHVAMVFSDSMTIDENGDEIPGWETLIDVDNQNGYVVLNGNSFLKENMIFGNRINNASAVLFRADMAKQIAEYEDFKYAGDTYFWCNLMLNSSFVYVDSKLNYFRRHQNRTTIKGYREGEMYLESLEIIRFIFKKLSMSFFSRLYVGGYKLIRLINDTKHIKKEMKDRIFNKFDKIFPNKVLCLCYFVIVKIVKKAAFKQSSVNIIAFSCFYIVFGGVPL